MRTVLLRCLLLASLCFISPSALTQTIDFTLPAPSKELSLETQTGATYHLGAELGDVLDQAEFDGNDLVLHFPKNRRIRLKNWLKDGETHARLQAEGSSVGLVQLMLLTGDDLTSLNTAAAAGANVHGDRMPASVGGGGRHTARRLLFRSEKETSDFGFHSYLLFDNASASGVAQQRRRMALEAYFSEISSEQALAQLGISRAAINVFWLPLTAPANSSIAELHEQAAGDHASKLVDFAERHYDSERARILLSALGLRGDGPWIVSYPLPLLDGTVKPVGDQLLVQDLSRAPPELVRSWIQHFKRRLEDEPNGLAGRLGGFLLSLRTEIANLANGLSITREAVAMTLGSEVKADSAGSKPASAPPEAGAAPSGDARPPAESAAPVQLASVQGDTQSARWLAALRVTARQQQLQALYEMQRDLAALTDSIRQGVEAGVMSSVALEQVQVHEARAQARQAGAAQSLALAELERTGGELPSLDPTKEQEAVLPASLDQAVEAALLQHLSAGNAKDAAHRARRDWIEYSHSKDAIAALEQAGAHAAKLMDAMKRQFNIGQRSVQELLSALEDNASLHQQLIERRLAHAEAAGRLLQLIGRADLLDGALH